MNEGYSMKTREALAQKGTLLELYSSVDNIQEWKMEMEVI